MNSRLRTAGFWRRRRGYVIEGFLQQEIENTRVRISLKRKYFRKRERQVQKDRRLD